jgi:hypothetical protein
MSVDSDADSTMNDVFLSDVEGDIDSSDEIEEVYARDNSQSDSCCVSWCKVVKSLCISYVCCMCLCGCLWEVGDEY